MPSKSRAESVKKRFSRSNISGLSLLILVVGLFWLAKDLGWINTKISIWPVLLIVFGLYWFIKPIAGKCWW